MNTNRFYLYATLGMLLFFCLITLLAAPYFIRSSAITLLDSSITASVQKAHQLAELSNHAISNELGKDDLADRIQKSIENTDQQDSFVSIFDWSGKNICYPDITQVGREAPSTTNVSVGDEALNATQLYDILFKQSKENAPSAEIVYLQSVQDLDWIIACYINANNIGEKMQELKRYFYTLFLIIGLLMWLFLLIAVRLISSYYERQLALKTTRFEDGVLNLSKLNDSLENYQKQLFEQQSNGPSEIEPIKEEEEISSESGNTKQRILTYVRNELLPIATNDIAYIYVENTITYVVRKDGKRSTSNDSLDQIYTSLNEKSFFRVNRQIIVAISAIDKITKFGNSKLKIEVHPVSEIDIFIGKNKAASFKQWLDL